MPVRMRRGRGWMRRVVDVLWGDRQATALARAVMEGDRAARSVLDDCIEELVILPPGYKCLAVAALCARLRR